MNNELDIQDIALLMEGLDALGESRQLKGFLGEILVSSLVKDDAQQEKWEKERAGRQQERDRQSQPLTEHIILLKAKLIQMKRKLEMDELLNHDRDRLLEYTEENDR